MQTPNNKEPSIETELEDPFEGFELAVQLNKLINR